jgi:hypothetical protein
MKKITDDTSDHDFCQELKCTYKDERYSVRDNGEVLRHPRVVNRVRPTDNKWTFGKPNKKTGYMGIASVRVHRIVATAFHGVPPTKEHVVDHRDTNRQNNRPENLRWLTKFENAMLNPITAKRIALVCGSVEEFLADPSKFRDRFPEPNFKWMCTVSKQEAQISLERMQRWAKSDKRPSGGSLDDWIFSRTSLQNEHAEVTDILMAKTLNAVQRNWRIPSEFPCCPQENADEPIAAYAENLKTGSVFCRNDVYSSLVLQSALSEDRQLLYVLTKSSEGENAVKPWALAKISYENGLFVHTSIQNFFAQEGAEKQYCLAQGLEWSGGDSIDDYC